MENKKELEKLLDEFFTLDYKILEQSENQVLLKKKDWGDGGVHLVIFAIIGAWTLGIANLVYGLYKYSTAEQVVIKVSDGEELSTPQFDGHSYDESFLSLPDHTAISKNWWYGVAISTGISLSSLVLSFSIKNTQFEEFGSVLFMFFIFSWLALPIAGYFDIQYVKKNSDWRPSLIIWILLFAVWFINVVAGIAYLYRRHEVLGEP